MPPSSTPSEPDSLQTVIRRTVATHEMLAAGDRVLVGVSGGADSMALLHLLAGLAPEFDIRLGVAHLNHGLRGAAANADAALVRRVAGTMGIACHVGNARVGRVRDGLGLSLEEAGRRVRYAYFNKVMIDGRYTKLALAHHLDDNAEQVLLALLRGAGPRGLSGILPVRGHIIRPLIGLPRSAITAHVESCGIPFVHDDSNDDPRFERNRVRHHLLPHLAANYNPRIRRHLNRLAEVIRGEEAWIEALVDEPFAAAVVERRDDRLTLHAGALTSAPQALARRLVRRAIETLCGSLRRIGFDHVKAVLELADGGGGEKWLHLPDGLRVRRHGKRLTFRRFAGRGRRQLAAGSESVTAAVTISEPLPDRIEIRSMGIGLAFSHLTPHALPAWDTVGRNHAFFDLDELAPPLVLRPLRPGDRFHPLGAPGSQKVKKFFIDQHICCRERTRAVVLADRRRIIWLVGRRSDERVKVNQTTTRVLGVEFFLLDTR